MSQSPKNANFAREFNKLNPQQKEAVEHIEGPVMVIAGPGTGKTQVVAMRIAQILTKTQLNPRNILALTFTEAGVTALRQRLETIIGPDAYQVGISTFHAFANEVVSTFPYVFGFVVEALQVTELERLQIIHQIVDKSSRITALRPVRTPTFHVASIAEAIRKLKQENILPDELRRIAKQHFETQVKSKLTALQKRSAERQSQINLEIADILSSYQETLKRRNLYDYEDMIIFAVNGLRTDQDVRAYYQERYQYILVDEYQDTNNAQNALVAALADFFPNPNLFVVGDDKQAIYRFQGASVANMLYFGKKYPHLKIISLKDNYRSTPNIIETSIKLISNNEHQLSHYLPLYSSDIVATRLKNEGDLQLVSFPSDETQYNWIVKQINVRREAGVKTEEIAVLFRRNNEVKAFRSFALKSGINIAGIETTNLISEPDVRRTLTILEAVANPADSAKVALAIGLIEKISPVIIARLANALEDDRSLEDAIDSLKLSKKEQEQITEAVKTLFGWATEQSALSLTELIERVLFNSRIIREIANLPNSLERLEIVKSFINEANRFAIQHPNSSLGSFLEYFNLLQDYHVRLSVNRLTPELKGVFVSTVHSAKGLEFDTVFLPNVTSDSWNDRVKRELIKLPPEITGLNTWNNSPVEDERRLFYVALTRAKNAIYTTYSRTNNDGKELLNSQFISEIKDCLKQTTYHANSNEAQNVLITSLSPMNDIILRKQEKQALFEQITANPFPYTHYRTYKLCPKQYLINCVLKFPTKPDARLVYGSIIHRALELFYKQFRARGTKPSQEALDHFLDQAARQTETFKGKNAVVDQAKLLLRAYYDHIGSDMLTPVGVEYSFTSHHVMLDDVWITGKFDRIDPIDPVARTVRIVDYKTGSQAKTRNEIEGNTKNSDGNLREQLVFYSLLASKDRQFPYQATEYSLIFLDDKHTFREEIFKVSREEREKLADDVRKTYADILSLEKFSHKREQYDKGCEICEIFSTLA